MKEVKHEGLTLKLLSRGELAKFVGVSIATIKKWVIGGIIPPPGFIDNGSTSYNFGRGREARKFYLVEEAIVLRDAMRKWEFGRGRIIPEQFTMEVHEQFTLVRNMVREGNAAFRTDYLVLEFSGQVDLREYLRKYIPEEHVHNVAELIYNAGNKFIGKRCSNGRESEEEDA